MNVVRERIIDVINNEISAKGRRILRIELTLEEFDEFLGCREIEQVMEFANERIYKAAYGKYVVWKGVCVQCSPPPKDFFNEDNFF